MTRKVIFVPTLNDNINDFKKLFGIYNNIKYLQDNVRFDFSRCSFLRPNAVAFLGGVARIVESQKRSAEFAWETLQDSWIKTTIRQNGFAFAFGDTHSPWDGTSIPYREDRTINVTDIMDYLTYNWIGKGWVQVSNRLRDAIAGNMWEIYNNAFEHGSSAVGVYSCGQYFPKYNILVLSVVDFGVGLPTKIRNFFYSKDVDKNLVKQLTGASCLKWAFQAGNTTKVGEPGGNGLDLLKVFINKNHGKLEVYSNEGYAIVENNGEKYKNNDVSFDGTFVHITLRCDEKIYRFSDEAE